MSYQRSFTSRSESSAEPNAATRSSKQARTADETDPAKQLAFHYGQLAIAPQASLMTYRDSGVAVPTIMRIAPYNGRLLGFVGDKSTTALRIRRNPIGWLGACDTDGNLSAEPLMVHCRLMSVEESPVLMEALRAKYGLRHRVSQFGYSLERLLRIRLDRHIGVELVLTTPPGPQS